jgi:hypothetical protein
VDPCAVREHIGSLAHNDSYLAKHETCHPSDNLGVVLAAAEFAERSGKDLLVALPGVCAGCWNTDSSSPSLSRTRIDYSNHGSYFPIDANAVSGFTRVSTECYRCHPHGQGGD